VAILQALISLLSRSLGKILNSIFGWAVVALFGQPSPKQKTLLSALVALAVAWPILVLGIAIPKIAAFVVAFVPPSAHGPSWVTRLIWLALALLVPITVGLVVASKAPLGTPREPFVKRVLRGFPITIGLAGAFLVMFATVPILRLASLLKKRQDEHVPLVTSAEAYAGVTEQLDRLFEAHDVEVSRSEPPWWLSAPARILMKLGGKAFRGFVPERLAYWRGPQLQVALYPSDLVLRGARNTAA